MALTQVSTGGIKDGQVHTADIASANITFDKFEATALDYRYTLGVSGSDHFTFQGEGLTGTVNDPTLYLTRGKTYRFALSYGSGSHPFRIQSTTGTSGTEYNTGVTNNAGAGGSTVIFEVPYDAPDVLYYQCTSHAAMNGIFYVTGAVADGSITSTKIANDTILNVDVNASAAIAGSKIDPTFTGTTGIKVPVGNTSERVNTQGMIRFNTSTSLLEYYDGASWKSLDAAPSPSSVNLNNIESSALPTNLVITGNNFASSVAVSFIDKNGTEINAGTTTRDSGTQITAQVPNTLTSANEPYSVKIRNTISNLSSTLSDAFNIDAAPVFGVAAGSLGSFGSYTAGSSITAITATDDEGDTITFSVTAGSLPAGISLGSNGVFSGNATSPSSTSTTSTFTVTASDGTNTNTRQYSITITPTYVQLSGSGTWSVPSGVTAAEILIVAGGSSGSRSANVGTGGGGAGGIVHRSSYTFTSTDISSGIAYVVGAGGNGVGISPEAYDGGYNSGADSTFAISTGTITAKGGGGGGGYGGGNNSIKPGFTGEYYVAEQGGSGGGGAWNQMNGAGSNQGTFSGWTSYGFGGSNALSGNSQAGAGGGGAAGSGSNVTHPGSGGDAATVAGDGGAGQLFSNFTAYGVNGYFGGGGGGGGPTAGSGGTGGGGDGGDPSDYNGHNAVDGTGGGGGGVENNGYNNYTYKSGDGGNGTILIKY